MTDRWNVYAQEQPLSGLLGLLIVILLATSSIVMFEPAPCDILFVLVFIIALGSGYSLLPAGVSPLMYMAIYLFFLANLISLLFARDLSLTLFFFAITVYMFLYFLFFVEIVGRHGRTAIELIFKGFIIAAFITAMIGILARFQLIPGADMFFRDEFGTRVKSTFKDPNVFAPFLVAASLVIFWKMLEGHLFRLRYIALITLFGTGILLAFSRGAYVHFVVSFVVFVVLYVLLIRDPRTLGKLVVMVGLLGIISIPIMAYTLIEVDLVDYLFQRASLQNYDVHRFSRQEIALAVSQESILGIGPGQFTRQRFEAGVHNLYLRVLSENGLLGFVGFAGFLLVWLRTCLAGIMARGENAAIYLTCFSVVAGILVESIVIDTLHWRHLFLFLAIPVGLYIYERREHV